MRDLPPLNALQAFHAAGVAGSFRDAGRMLNVTPSAISHQIRALEEWLERFEKRHPDISLEIETTNRVVDLQRENVDIAIRNLREMPQGLAATKLFDVRPVPMCTAKIAAQLKAPADLAGQTLIHLSSRRGVWSSWLRSAGCAGLKSKRSLSFDTMPAALEAAAQGRGVAIGIDGLMQEWEGSLVRPFAIRAPGDASYYLVHRRGDGVRPEVRAFANWITTEMAAFKRKAAR